MNGVGGVVTTGIYCVPGCPARPHPANVRPFRCAAAAEAAGFRACHRCRPYRVEADVTGAPLVARAVELIAAGALDDTDEAGLPARLGRPVPGLEPLGLSHAFPTADALRDARDEDLEPATAAAVRRIGGQYAPDK